MEFRNISCNTYSREESASAAILPRAYARVSKYHHSRLSLSIFAEDSAPPISPLELNRPSAAKYKVSLARKETSEPRDAPPVAQLGGMID